MFKKKIVFSKNSAENVVLKKETNDEILFILKSVDFKLQEFLYFYSRVRNYCLFTGKSRSIYLNMVSRFKIKQYQSFGLLAGLRRSRH